MEIPDPESVDIALTTTRSVRRRIDWERPVHPEVIERCIDIATDGAEPRGLALPGTHGSRAETGDGRAVSKVVRADG